MTGPRPSAYQRLLRRADLVMGILVLIWTAEALVRFGISTAVTGVVYLYFTLRFAMTLQGFLPAILRSLAVLVYPALCLISTFWSVMPEVTAIASVQIAFTILIGLFLGLQFSLPELARMILFALGLTMILSLGNFGGIWGNAYSYEGGYLGIYTNKNALGQRGALLVLTCIFLVASDPSRWVRAAALVIMGLTSYFLVLSKSATSVLMSVAMGASFAAAVLATARRNLRPFLWLAGITAAACTVVTLVALGINPWVEVLEAFDKNTTLTGRTVLWEQGFRKIAQAPMLGQGAMAYWVAPQYAQEISLLRGEYGTTVAAFHNFVIEILVGLGPLGLMAMMLLIGASVAAVWRHATGTTRLWALWALGLLVMLSLLGSSLFRQHEITLVLVVALGASARRDVLLAPAVPDARTSA